MGSSQEIGPFLGPQNSTTSLLKKEPKRDPTLEKLTWSLRL